MNWCFKMSTLFCSGLELSCRKISGRCFVPNACSAILLPTEVCEDQIVENSSAYAVRNWKPNERK